MWQELLTNPITLIVLALSLYLFVFKSKRNLPPGPRRLPIFGNLFNVKQDTMLEDIRKLRQQYGNVFSLSLGSMNMIIINGYDNLKEVFVKRGDEFSRRPNTLHFSCCEYSGIVCSSGEVWKAQRTFALKSLRSFGFGKKSHESKILDEVAVFLNILDETKGNSFSMTDIIHRCISNVICSIALGKHYEHNDPEFKQLLDMFQANLRVVHVASLTEVFPFLRLIPGDVFKRKKLLDNVQCFKNVMATYVTEHKRTFDENNLRDFIDCYIKELQHGQNQSHHFTETEENGKCRNGKKKECKAIQSETKSLFNIAEENLLYALADLFVAGTETTSTAITWAIAFLINYSDIQDQIHKELDTVVGSSRPPSLDDRNSLPYFEAFTTEVLRCGNIVGFSLPHSNEHDTTINGFFIPAGSSISPNLDSVLQDPKLFPEPSKFDPTRFLDAEGHFSNNEFILPFGIGRRVCPGEVLARSEFFLFMTSILQRFVLHPVDKANPPTLKATFAVARAPLPYQYIAVRRT